jgi:hypothetical protein
VLDEHVQPLCGVELVLSVVLARMVQQAVHQLGHLRHRGSHADQIDLSEHKEGRERKVEKKAG